MTRWGLAIRALHWITVFVLFLQLIVVFGLQSPGLAMMVWMPWHLSLGFALLGVVILRLIIRTLPRRRTPSSGWIAGMMQAALYLVLIAATLTGWFAFRPSPLVPTPLLFDIVPMQTIHLPFGAPWTNWHRTLVWILLSLVAAHAAAAAYHFLVLKDGVLQRMLFGRAGEP